MPAHGWVRTPLTVSYSVHNHTHTLVSLNLNMEPSEAFMFAGHKQVSLVARQYYVWHFFISLVIKISKTEHQIRFYKKLYLKKYDVR